MKYQKILYLTANGLLAASICTTAISPVLAAENHRITADSQCNEKSDNAVKEADSQPGEESSDKTSPEANSTQVMEEAESEASQENEPASEETDSESEDPTAENSQEEAEEQTNQKTDAAQEPFKPSHPDQITAYGQYKGVNWCLNKQGRLILYSGYLVREEDDEENAPWTAYNRSITSVVVNGEQGDGKVHLVGSAAGLFKSLTQVQYFDFSRFDTSECTNMKSVFANCCSLWDAGFYNWDTSKVETMEDMFANCYTLEKLMLSSFNTSNVKNMAGMFVGCLHLKQLDISSFDTSKVQNMESMFQYCARLEDLDLSHLDTQQTANMSHMFSSCQRLRKLNLNGWNTTNVQKREGMFEDNPLEEITFQRSYLYASGDQNDFFPKGSIYFSDSEKYPDQYVPKDAALLLFKNLKEDESITAYISNDFLNPARIVFHSNDDANKEFGYVIREHHKNFPAYPFQGSKRRFLGWNTKPDGSGESYKDQAQIPESFRPTNKKIIHLYAQYENFQTIQSKLYATSLRLGADLGINFFFEVDAKTAKDPNAVVMIKQQGLEPTAIPLSQAAKVKLKNSDKILYKVVWRISPVHYSDGIDTWIQKDCEDSVHTHYSVGDYIKKVQQGEQYSQKMKNLTASLLNYGIKAQEANWYHEGILQEQCKYCRIEDSVKNYFARAGENEYYQPQFTGTLAEKGIVLENAQILHDPNVAVRFSFLCESNPNLSQNLKVTWKGRELPVEPTSKRGTFTVTLSGLEGQEMYQPIALKFTDESTQETGEYKFNFQSLLFEYMYKDPIYNDVLKGLYTYVHFVQEYLTPEQRPVDWEMSTPVKKRSPKPVDPLEVIMITPYTADAERIYLMKSAHDSSDQGVAVNILGVWKDPKNPWNRFLDIKMCGKNYVRTINLLDYDFYEFL